MCCPSHAPRLAGNDLHSGRTHDSIPHGADEHNARASRSQSYCWNTVAGSRLPGIHPKQNKHSARTHGSIPHGADEHNARAYRSLGGWVAGPLLEDFSAQGRGVVISAARIA